MSIEIRPATAADVPGILEIYNEAILHSTASYDYEPFTLEQRLEWFEEHLRDDLPVFVAVAENGAIAGWGSLGQFRSKIGYRFTVENSVYVATSYQGQGLGKRLLIELIEAARERGMHVIVAGVDAANEISIRLHTSLGFETVGHFKQVGYKFDRWLDVVFLQLTLEPKTS